MTEHADQLVLEYLGRVADAAHGALRSDERLDFLTRLRTRIDQMRARAKAERPGQVRGILERFGDPAVLVERERERLAAVRRAQEQADQAVGTNETAVTFDPPQGLRPNQTQPIPLPGAVPGQPATERSASDASAAEHGAAERVLAEQSAAVPEAGGTDRAAPIGDDRERGAAARQPSDFLDIARAHKQASVAIVLLGFGALALPVPLWIIGLALLIATRGWSMGEKLLGAACPVVAVAVYALSTDRAADVLSVAAYSSADGNPARLVFGLGGLVGAGYLAWRLRTRVTR